MQLSADDVRTAVGGQWIVPPAAGNPAADGIRAFAPFMLHGVGTDTREDLRGRLFVALRGERFDAHSFLADAAARGAAAALVDRKAPAGYARPAGLPLLEVGDTRVALGDLARTWRARLRAKVVAITGSSGKTTTRRLVDAALGAVMTGSASPKSFNNDIGVPLTVLGAQGSDGYLVVEIGMNHPGEIAPLARIAAPHVAIITMAGRAHLGGMGSQQAIVDEKSSLVDGLGTMGIAVVNGDQPELVAAVEARAKPGVRVVTFGTAPGCQWRLGARAPGQAGGPGPAQVVTVAEPDGATWDCPLGLPGDYNAMNALAAIVAARMLGVPADAIARALPAVLPAEMRMTRQDVGGYAVFNDAYNANPDAVQAALRAFPEVAPAGARRVVVLGDMLELGAESAALHAEVGRAASATAPALAVFVGTESAHGAAAVRAAGGAVQALHVPQLDEAGVTAIEAALRPGDAILLKGSRGSRMERLVEALAARAAGAATGRGSVPCSTT
jgi:UDP-N-acetylmuramoyl-tripeptide--D-alanyl-D-alanine ligase